MKILKTIDTLTEYFARLPGVGHRSAEKMAYAVLGMDEETVNGFMNAIGEAKHSVHHCPKCGIYTEDEICEICSSEDRDKTRLIVVSNSKDVFPFEKLNSYKGQYHVLGGVLSAINGVSVADLRINELINRIHEDNVKEVILATNPTTEGETTALYIAKILEKENIKISRLAYGLPMGGHLEFTDTLTLSRALEGRKDLKGE